MKEYWYLRNGDLRPERLGEDNAGYANRHTALEQLADAGNLFNNEASALHASNQVRLFLRNTCLISFQGYSQQSGKHCDNNPQPSPSAWLEIQQEGNSDRSDERQSPMPQTASRLQDDNSQASVLKIHLEVQIHS